MLKSIIIYHAEMVCSCHYCYESCKHLSLLSFLVEMNIQIISSEKENSLPVVTR